VERFNLKNLSDLEVSEMCHIKVENRTVALLNLNEHEVIKSLNRISKAQLKVCMNARYISHGTIKNIRNVSSKGSGYLRSFEDNIKMDFQ
jgi:flagellar motor switch protein FliG